MANDTPKLGDARVGAKELNHAHSQRAEARAEAHHQRHDGDEAAVGVAHGVEEKLIAQQKPLSPQVVPPEINPQWRCEGRPGEDLRVE